MFQALSIVLALIIGVILIIALSGGKSNKPYDLSGFLKWSNEIHAGERISTTVIEHKATSESDSVKITFNFKTDRGVLHDKALNKKYKVARVDGKYITLDD